MVSAKHVHQIEDHWEAIYTRVSRQIQTHPMQQRLKAMPEADQHEICKRILHNLGHWLTTGGDHILRQRFEEIGHQRFREKLPLYEAVCTLQLMRECTIDYVHDQELPQNNLEIYAEEELELQLARFFDILILHMVKGYEEELRRTHGLAA
jgi:hypothetical protein